MIRLTLAAEIRRSSDHEAAGQRLAALVAEKAGIPAPAFTSAARKRGGRVGIVTEIDVPEQAGFRLAADICDAVEENPNLIDRLDDIRVGVWDAGDGRMLGFSRSDYHGWLRDAALAALAESR